MLQAVLLRSREQVADELARLQKDNDSLQGKHSLHASLQQAEDSVLPDTLEVPCFPVLRSRDARLLKWPLAGSHARQAVQVERGEASSVVGPVALGCSPIISECVHHLWKTPGPFSPHRPAQSTCRVPLFPALPCRAVHGWDPAVWAVCGPSPPQTVVHGHRAAQPRPSARPCLGRVDVLFTRWPLGGHPGGLLMHTAEDDVAVDVRCSCGFLWETYLEVQSQGL